MKQAFHTLPQMNGFVLCSHCLALALKHSKQADKIFGELKKALNSPGSIEAIKNLKGDLPKGIDLIQALFRESQGLHSKELIPKGAALVKGAEILAEKLAIKRQTKPAWWMFGSKTKILEDEHLILSFKLVEDLIKIGFNRKAEQDIGIYKVIGTKLLFFTIVFVALAEAYGLEFNRLERQHALPLGTRLFSIGDLVNGKLTDDAYRLLTKEFRNDGFKVKSEDVSALTAYHWYQSRVVYSGATQYCLQEGNGLKPSNVNNEIRACDVSMGYPRRSGKTKNSRLETKVQTNLLINASLLLEALVTMGPLLEKYTEFMKSQNISS